MPTLVDVAASVTATEEGWSRGEIVMQPWRRTEVLAGGQPLYRRSGRKRPAAMAWLRPEGR